MDITFVKTEGIYFMPGMHLCICQHSGTKYYAIRECFAGYFMSDIEDEELIGVCEEPLKNVNTIIIED